MKKNILMFCLFAFCSFAFGKDYRVSVSQAVQIPGKEYLQNLTAPSVTYSALSDGKLNFKYKFSLNADDDEERTFIYCKIEFPQSMPIEILSLDGVLGLNIDGKQVAALEKNENVIDFFIPVKEKMDGYIEIQASILEEHIGADLPIKIAFEGYELGFFRNMKNNIIKSSDNSWLDFVIPGRFIYRAVVDRHENYQDAEGFFDYIKEDYSTFSMSSSLKSYKLQIK